MNTNPRITARARSIARSARMAVARGAVGPPAVYARIVDGERLWLALDRDAGEPALRYADGTIVRPDNELPPGADDIQPDYRSVRWRLAEALPATDTEADVITLPEGGGRPRQVRSPGAPPQSPARLVISADGRWEFRLEDGDLGLRVRRATARRVARLLSITDTDGSVELRCTEPGTGDLMFVREKGGLTARLSTTRTDDGLVAIITHDDLPDKAGLYRVVLGEPGQEVPITRLRNNLRITDPPAVVLPTISAPDSGQVVARFKYTRNGSLRMRRIAGGVS